MSAVFLDAPASIGLSQYLPTKNHGMESKPPTTLRVAGGARGAATALRTGQILGESANLARELGDLPGNTVTPRYLANAARKVCRDGGLRCRVHGKAALKRMRMGEEELVGLSKTKAKGALHWTSYGAGSFVLDPNAKKGKSSSKDIRGDPESFWRSYGDVSTRSAWLRAYAAEKLPQIFEVVTVRQTPCGKCGGKGQVKHSSVRGLEALGGAHEWHQTCPRCFGAGRDRGIGYK